MKKQNKFILILKMNNRKKEFNIIKIIKKIKFWIQALNRFKSIIN